MKFLKRLSLIALLSLSAAGHADDYTSQSGLSITSMRNLTDRVHITFDNHGVCQTNVYSLLLTEADPATNRRREALLSTLMFAAAAEKKITLEIWTACPTPEESWGMSFDSMGVIVDM